MTRHRLAAAATGVLAAAGVALAAWALHIPAKAVVAQALLQRAWAETRAGVREIRPWPWADTFPVARLAIPARGLDAIVLAGATGRTLAFGPGHVDGTARPGTPGHAVVGGHRDTHLAALRDVRRGDRVIVERADGTRRAYRVAAAEIADSRLPWQPPDFGADALTLVTCYPFGAAAPGGPLRYLVHAVAMDPTDGVRAAAAGALNAR